MTRHAIGKLVHMHFASNQDAADRLIKLGEEAFRVHNVGAPQIDEMVSAQYTELAEIEDKLCVHLQGGYLLGVMHPVTEEADKAEMQAETTFPIPKSLFYRITMRVLTELSMRFRSTVKANTICMPI